MDWPRSDRRASGPASLETAALRCSHKTGIMNVKVDGSNSHAINTFIVRPFVVTGGPSCLCSAGRDGQSLECDQLEGRGGGGRDRRSCQVWCKKWQREGPVSLRRRGMVGHTRFSRRQSVSRSATWPLAGVSHSGQCAFECINNSWIQASRDLQFREAKGQV